MKEQEIKIGDTVLVKKDTMFYKTAGEVGEILNIYYDSYGIKFEAYVERKDNISRNKYINVHKNCCCELLQPELQVGDKVLVKEDTAAFETIGKIGKIKFVNISTYVIDFEDPIKVKNCGYASHPLYVNKERCELLQPEIQKASKLETSNCTQRTKGSEKHMVLPQDDEQRSIVLTVLIIVVGSIFITLAISGGCVASSLVKSTYGYKWYPTMVKCADKDCGQCHILHVTELGHENCQPILKEEKINADH